MKNDTVISFGEEETPRRVLNCSRRRNIVVLHLLFRLLAIVTYLFCTWFLSSFIVSFLLILCFLSVDFWCVKNVSGRLLVGLRWWNFVDEEGKSHWKFEAAKDMSKYSAVERKLFWSSLALCPALWLLFLLVAFFSFKWTWLTITVLGLAMSGANLYGYFRCQWNSGQEMSNYFRALGFRWLLDQTAKSTSQSATTTPNHA